MGKLAKRKSITVQTGVEKYSLGEAIEYLKEHVLLQQCTLAKLGRGSRAGRLVWARNPGSVFWPALIVNLEDKPDYNRTEPDIIPPNDYRCVMFLETTFRFGVLEWKDLILAEEDMIDEQNELVCSYNKFIIKKKWSADKQYKEAVMLLKDFIPIDIIERQAFGFNLSIERKKIKETERSEKIGLPVKELKETLSTATLNAETGVSDRKRDNPKYGLRQSLPRKIPDQTPTVSRSVSAATSRSQTPDAMSVSTTSGGDSKEETLSDISRKAKKRPKVGGADMKQFAEVKFLSTDKGFRLDSKTKKDIWMCGTCFEEIGPGQQATCHDVPHHKDCLTKVLIQQKDGTSQDTLKCKICADQLCFECKSKEKNQEFPTKCSKCDLRFHRSCVALWPQAEVQGSSGPITCPVHFCHTCLGEQKVYGKMRNVKVLSGGKLRCLKCVSTYHKHCCIPAGTIETISGKDFLICPKHTLPDIKISQRRFGCLSCGINLKAKATERVDCSLCLQIFHPACVGYTEKEKDAGIPLSVFGKDYKCVSCLWGLHPLCGQVVWFQQSGSTFWPGRILFPRESVGRNDLTVRQIGEYSIKYFGSEPSYFDKASRTFALHLTTVKMFTKLNIYKETPKVKSAYEEASFFNQLVEDLRDSQLVKPEPYYKKIDKNIYRNGTLTRKKQDVTGFCYCSQQSDENVCTQDSECHNRDTAVECNDKNCNAGSRCKNRMFSLKLKDVELTEPFLCPSKGWAVRAATDLKDGDFVIEYCGEIINNLEMQVRANKKSEEDPLYLLEIDKKTFIDAEFYGNVSRLINHSCEPNCRTEKYTSDGRPVVGVFAQTAIKKGEELTFDYAYGNQSAAPFRCFCGTESCRLYIGKDVSEELVNETPNPDLEKYDKQCAKCTFGGYVLCCDYDGCYKVYHKSCAQLSREPDNEWYCPDHKVEPPKVEKKRKSAAKQNLVAMKQRLGEPAPKKNHVVKLLKKSMVQKTTTAIMAIEERVSNMVKIKGRKRKLELKRSPVSDPMKEGPPPKKPTRVDDEFHRNYSIIEKPEENKVKQSGPKVRSSMKKSVNGNWSRRNSEKSLGVHSDTDSAVKSITNWDSNTNTVKEPGTSGTSYISHSIAPTPLSSLDTKVNSRPESRFSNVSTLTGNSDLIETDVSVKNTSSQPEPLLQVVPSISGTKVVNKAKSSSILIGLEPPAPRTRSQRVAKRRLSNLANSEIDTDTPAQNEAADVLAAIKNLNPNDIITKWVDTQSQNLESVHDVVLNTNQNLPLGVPDPVNEGLDPVNEGPDLVNDGPDPVNGGPDPVDEFQQLPDELIFRDVLFPVRSENTILTTNPRNINVVKENFPMDAKSRNSGGPLTRTPPSATVTGAVLQALERDEVQQSSHSSSIPLVAVHTSGQKNADGGDIFIISNPFGKNCSQLSRDLIRALRIEEYDYEYSAHHRIMQAQMAKKYGWK